MIKKLADLSDIVDRQYADDYFNVFFSDGFLKYDKKNGNSIILLASEKYVIPIEIRKKLIFKYAHFVSEPFEYKEDNENLQLFLDNVCQYLKDIERVQWIDQNSASSFFLEHPKNSKYVPFGSHVINLSLTEEELWKNVHTKHRNVIKKAEKDGVVIVSGNNQKLMDDYHLIDVDTWKRSNKNAAGINELFSKIRCMGDNVTIYMAYLNERPQSGAIFYYNKAMCYYMYGANCDKPHTGAGNLLQWKAILDMKKRDVRYFSFVGCRINEDENSKYHGIQRFKERFGGKLIKGYLFKVDFNPFMHLLFNMAVALQGLLNNHRWAFPKDIIDQEISKWSQE